jgi:hypothetical protein
MNGMRIFIRFLFLCVALFGFTVSGSAYAGTMILDTFADQTTDPINLPATKLLMATVNTTGDKGGNDASATAVTIGGTVVAADIAEVCVNYAAVEITCQANPNPLSNISLSLPGNQKGGAAFDYTVTLNPSAGGKTISLMVVSITNTNLTDNIPLNDPAATTATVAISGGVTAPTLDASTLDALANVTSSTATLGGNIDTDGGDPPITEAGIVWNITGGTITENATAKSPTPTVGVPFSDLISGLNTGSQIWFRSYAVNNTGTDYGPDNSFYTEPAASPASATIDNVGDTSFRINWPSNPAGSGDGALVIVSTGAITATPTDGNLHSPNSDFTLAEDLGGVQKVVYRGTGATSVTVTNLASSTTYNVSVFYSAGTVSGETGINYRQTSPATTSQLTNTPAVPPTVTVDDPTTPTTNSAVLGGKITNDGGGAITDKGIYYNTASPAENGTKVSMGTGTADFSQTVGSLAAGTQYWVKAYAVNSADESLSAQEKTFTTLTDTATVTQDAVTPLTATSASFTGHVTSDGGADLSEWGTVWSTSPNPTTADTKIAEGTVPPDPTPTIPPTFNFTHTLINLPAGVTVYYRAYAINPQGTAYSAELDFIPAGSPELVATPPVATSVTYNSAVLGGEITSNGGSAITARGTVWNTTGAPTLADNPQAEGGTAVGVFSHTRTGLQAGTTIYYRSYATNSVGTGYSANDQTFTTGTEPTVQASNITFPQVAGKSMRISWTRGNGEGSLVVMRVGADPTDPTDGVDYAANPDFTLAAETAAGSKVVYKGTGSNIHVIGLDLSTTYHVAVYEYASSPVDYLLGAATGNPASTTTTNIPVHNMDYASAPSGPPIECDDCHNHGTFGATGAELKVVCESCHNPSGVASAKQEFDNHLTPTKNPGVDYVDCGSCHELHNPGGANTTVSNNAVTGALGINKSFLRTNVEKYVPTARTDGAALHNDDPGHADPPTLANNPERAIEGGDNSATANVGARGYCQVCHSLTKYHRGSRTDVQDLLGVTTSGFSNQCHDGEGREGDAGDCTSGVPETNCGSCHQHNNQFIGVGGSQTCIECHGGGGPATTGDRPDIPTQFDNNSSHITVGSASVAQPDCLVCHNFGAHTGAPGGAVSLWNADDYSTTYTQPNANSPSYTPPTSEGAAFENHCLSCHDADGATGVTAQMSDPDRTNASPFTGSGAPPVIDVTAWNNSSHKLGGVATTTPVTCVGGGTNGCHSSGHGSEENKLLAPVPSLEGGNDGLADNPEVFCLRCHDSDGPSSFDIQAAFTGASKDTLADKGGGAVINQRHDVLVSDQGRVVDGTTSDGVISCAGCHDPHGDPAGTPVVNPDTGNPLVAYDPANYGGGVDPSFGNGEIDYIPYCTACHDNAPPSANVTMPSLLVDVATEWAAGGADQHGVLAGGSSGNAPLKAPWTEDAATAALNCTTCHGSHGTANIFNLKTSITVGATVMSVGGGDMGITPSTTYELPYMDGKNVSVEGVGVQTDHYWGGWCSFCHQMNHKKSEGTPCDGGHMHGGGKF